MVDHPSTIFHILKCLKYRVVWACGYVGIHTLFTLLPFALGQEVVSFSPKQQISQMHQILIEQMSQK